MSADRVPASPEAAIPPRAHQAAVTPHEVAVRNTSVSLTPREFEVLRFMLERQDELLSVDEISTAIWGHGTVGSRNFVESQISRVRSKLARAGAGRDVIATLRGLGYVIRTEPGSSGHAADYTPSPRRSSSA